MGLFNHAPSYSTKEEAKKTLEKVRSGRIRIPGDVSAVAKIKDNDKLFALALTDNAAVSLAAVSAITIQTALRRLIELAPDNAELLKACAANPIRDWDTLMSALRHAQPDTQREILSALTDPNELVYVTAYADRDPALYAVERLQDVDCLEQVVRGAAEPVADAALARLKELAPNWRKRLKRMLLNCIDTHNYRRAAFFRSRIDENTEAIDERIVDTVLKEVDKGDDKELIAATQQLLDTVTSNAALYRFAHTAKVKYVSYNYSPVYYASKFVNKVKRIEQEKKDLLNSAVRRLDEDLLYQLAKEDNGSVFTAEYASKYIQNETYLIDLLRNNGHIDRKTVLGRIRDPAALYEVASSVGSEKLLYRDILEKLAETEGGQPYLFMLLKDSIGKGVRFHPYVLQDEDALYEAILQYPDYPYRRELCERYLAVATNAPRIVEIFQLYDLGSEHAVEQLSDFVSLKTTALKAKRSRTRSLAAKRMMDLGLDKGHVTVEHNVCADCGGEIRASVVCEGTIEQHRYYECKSCGKSTHETILNDTSKSIYGDYYTYNP
ncbi:MAG: hypothetical protein IJH53_06055 [Oscillospiraceae bacterium]|nr:hypothetical protein [Oscillospiraceae bacterium]